MLFAVVALASLLSVSAFAPSGRTASSALRMAGPFAGGLPGADGPELKKVTPAFNLFIYGSHALAVRPSQVQRE